MDLLGYKVELSGNVESNKRNDDFFSHTGALPAYMNCIPASNHMHGSESVAPVIIHLAGCPGRFDLACEMLKTIQCRFTNRRLTDRPIDLF